MVQRAYKPCVSLWKGIAGIRDFVALFFVVGHKLALSLAAARHPVSPYRKWNGWHFPACGHQQWHLVLNNPLCSELPTKDVPYSHSCYWQHGSKSSSCQAFLIVPGLFVDQSSNHDPWGMLTSPTFWTTTCICPLQSDSITPSLRLRV